VTEDGFDYDVKFFFRPSAREWAVKVKAAHPAQDVRRIGVVGFVPDSWQRNQWGEEAPDTHHLSIDVRCTEEDLIHKVADLVHLSVESWWNENTMRVGEA
jgi:hypothetical protein